MIFGIGAIILTHLVPAVCGIFFNSNASKQLEAFWHWKKTKVSNIYEHSKPETSVRSHYWFHIYVYFKQVIENGCSIQQKLGWSYLIGCVSVSVVGLAGKWYALNGATQSSFHLTILYLRIPRTELDGLIPAAKWSFLKVSFIKTPTTITQNFFLLKKM